MRPLESLRGRLVAAMLLVFVLGLGGAIALRPFEERGGVLARYGMGVLREPYQDLFVLLLFSLGAMALIWLVSGWSLRHLAGASREAARVGPARPAARISTARLPAEIRPLVNAVNGALDRLADAYEAEQRFVADAAHELRTPLAVLSLRLQRAKLDGAPDWPALDRDLAQVNRLVSQLLDLARKEHAAQIAPPPDAIVNLSRVAREAAAAMIPLAEDAGRTIEVELPDALPVRGRLDDLRDMTRNLLDNALLHGRGTIRLAGQALGGNAILTVSDEGHGIPEPLHEAVFDRFRKENPGTPGSGLGLAIAKQVAVGHGGSIGVVSGRGCTVRVVLPAAGISVVK